MKRILATLALVLGLGVIATIDATPASAHSGCGLTWFPPANGITGYGWSDCTTLSSGEWQRVEYKCADYYNNYDPVGNVANGWNVGPWQAAVRPANSTGPNCSASYPYVALIQTNWSTGH